MTSNDFNNLQMKQHFFLSTLCLILTVCLGNSTANAEPLAQALITGKPSISLRYRFEDVTQDNLSQDSQASTLRSRLGYRTDNYKGFKIYLEIDDVRRIGSADYSTPSAGPLGTSIGPKNTGYPIIADPLDTELNQLNIVYSNKETMVTLGRQRIIRGNARFIGNVGWRQHEQTFDGLSIENKPIKDLSIFAAYITKRNTITFTDISQDTLLIDAKFTGLPHGVFSTYYYDIKVDDSSAKWQNIGLRYAGEFEKYFYTLEFAQQKNNSDEQPTYSLLEGGYKFGGLSLGVGIETLGNDKQTSFATPLATLHKFNGFADQFLATPNQGLADKFLKIEGNLSNVKLAAVYHQFDSDKGSIDFGSELDVSATTNIAEKYTVGAKYANYAAGDVQTNKVDTAKFWLWAEAKF
ncbi:MAG: hypothetical protein ACI9XU_000553 [Arenicella sp.]|jgi:hypothetical protein